MARRNQNVSQLRVVGTQTTLREGQNVEEVELFDNNGARIVLGAKGVAVASVTAPNATDLATAEALANANKIAINALITSLHNAGLIA